MDHTDDVSEPMVTSDYILHGSIIMGMTLIIRITIRRQSHRQSPSGPPTILLLLPAKLIDYNNRFLPNNDRHLLDSGFKTCLGSLDQLFHGLFF